MIKTSTNPPYNTIDSYKFIERLKNRDEELLQEFEEKGTTKEESFKMFEGRKSLIAIESNENMELRPESIVAHFRPVLLIRDNKIVPEFIGDEVKTWMKRIMEQSAILNTVIPAVGRIEINNNPSYNWVGTGWLVDKDIIVTNRHVATIFTQTRGGFGFKIGFPTGRQTAHLDFLEEDQRSNSLNFEVDSVLWMAENDNNQPDVAFLRLKTPLNGPILPKPIELEESVEEGQVVVTIGYPARDPDFPNLELELQVFNNIFDKKRLAPGEIIKISDVELQHDCSTLGGNSGSAIINLATGKAVGLHFAGIFMKANYAVPASKISELLKKLKAGELSGMKIPSNEIIPVAQPDFVKLQNLTQNDTPGTFSMELNIPLKITIEVGGMNLGTIQSSNIKNLTPIGSTNVSEQALNAARQSLKDWPDIHTIRLGYRFRRGWITDEEVIVVEVLEKKDLLELRKNNTPVIPSEFLGVGVDVRSIDVLDQLQNLNVNINAESVPRSGNYIEPKNLKLEPINENMTAIFHVSPDSGFPNLKKFIARIKKNLTATMYEWDINHISNAIAEAITNVDGNLKMVTQKTGTQEAVEDMKQRLKNRFQHQWASVGTTKLIPKAYHIKVATRDREEFWLSSGNWKDSNQADINPADENSKSKTPLNKHNREWHAIIENKKLASLFEDYINFDFEEAKRVPLEEKAIAEPVFLIIKENALSNNFVPKYFNPLIIKDRKLNIQPLLTPDRDDRGRRMFMVFATSIIQNAKSSISIENQSFTLLEDNNEAFERFFNVLKIKQDEGLVIKIIFRNLEEFHNSNKKVLEELKKIGLDTNTIKVQNKCHTKAIIVDPEDENNAAVLFGSHNLTNSGALFNRDASLLVRDSEVARYFKEIFEFDWNNLAKHDIGDIPTTVNIALHNEAPSVGHYKISLEELLANI
ncbi:phospholipase D-like domain-containing protein [Flavobacterium sp. 5]|uniref:phospholipase D-like domain-containing protein n=1 Tax=Flavobacterium sp. 5 TaxID=2035199 RepID=UPI000C2BBABA|nr:phospholipase D-like domain-containing protein [Flavobacterium sp. 5]PKB18301.1 phosphatidylserine/phosphatidylglycerophosphate/cardiolipin synthase-like enzyme [Flavobacterium sp. 5]